MKNNIQAAAGRLQITVTPDDATLSVNNRQIPILAAGDGYWSAPGTVEILAEKQGFDAVRQTFEVKAGTSEEIQITLQKTTVVAAPAPPAPHPPTVTDPPILTPAVVSPEATNISAQKHRTLSPGSWASMGTTLALGIATGVFAGVATIHYNDAETFNLEHENSGDPDAAKNWSEAKDKHELFKYLTWGFAGGTGAAAIVAAVLVARDLTHAKKETLKTGRITAGPGSLQVAF